MAVDSIKKSILSSIDDLVANFMYYDRKEDEDLPLNAIENAVKTGKITIEDMTERFKIRLTSEFQ
jgi:hypothetical protein